MGDIGTDQKEFEFEPFPATAPAEPTLPVHQPVTAPQEEPVPA